MGLDQQPGFVLVVVPGVLGMVTGSAAGVLGMVTMGLDQQPRILDHVIQLPGWTDQPYAGCS